MQGYRAKSRNGLCEIWKKPLSDGHLGVGIFNRGDRIQTVASHWSDLEISGGYRIRDLWAHSDLGNYDSVFSSEA